MPREMPGQVCGEGITEMHDWRHWKSNNSLFSVSHLDLHAETRKSRMQDTGNSDRTFARVRARG